MQLTLRVENNTLLRDFALIAFACFAICLSGQIAIPLWFTPVPLITQNTVVLLSTVLLGSRRGALATWAFLAQGALGLPVFTNGGCGFLYFFGPTGGYLIGYLVASFVAGFIAEKKKTLGNAFLAFSVGSLIIFSFGATYLSTFIGVQKALLLGVVPFIVGDLLKILVSLKLLQRFNFTK